MRVLVLTPYLYNTVPGQRFRIEQWARLLEPQGVQFHFVPFESEALRQVLHSRRHHTAKARELISCIARRAQQLRERLEQDRWDLLFLYRELLPIGPPLLERWMARRGIPIVYDFDDAIFLPDVSEANRRFQWLKWPQKTGTICRLSTHVTVGNRYLREFVLRYTKQVSVIPTSIDTDRYLPKTDLEIRGKPVIGWSGSFTTIKHLRTAEPFLQALARRMPFRLKVIGSPEFCLPGVEVEAKGWDPQTEIEDLTSFDIGIMPLPQDAWSLGKCGLKALQYMALGIPTIASPVGVNSEIIRDGANGFIASGPREWVEKIGRLVEDSTLRAQFAREGRRTVEERFSAKVQAPRLLSVLEQVREGAKTVVSIPKEAFGNGPQNILCFSSIDWDFVWQGHQEIMTTLTRQGHRVLFVENTGVRNPQLRDFQRIRRRLSTWRRSLQGFRRQGENLVLFSPLVLPFPYARWARRINRRLMLSAIRRWMEAMKFEAPICWVFLPTPLTLELVEQIPHRALIYYCIDSFVNSTPAAERIAASEQQFLRRSDLVFVTSQELFRYAAPWSRQVHLFPFGVNPEPFEKARLRQDPPPEELAQVRRPIIGYVGGIHQWVDQELLLEVARSVPNYSFVLVGPVQTDVELLRREPNIFFLGQKPHEALPEFIRQFDVGIIPYRLTDYTSNVYPTKLNEYHAMGKPVVSTALPEVKAFNQRYGNFVRIALNPADFHRRLEEAIQEDSQELLSARVAAAQDNSWDRRIDQMQRLIQEAMVRRGTEGGLGSTAQAWGRVSPLRSGIRRGAIGLLLLLGVLSQTPLFWVAANPLVIQDSPQSADAVVVFAGGVGESGQAGEGYQERVQKATELYHQGYAPSVLFLSGYTWRFQEAQIMRALAVSLEVPASATLTESRARNTCEYVLRVKEIARERGWKSVLLVTTPYHTRRADRVFRRVAPELKLFHAPIVESSFYAHRWGPSLRQMRGILHEVAALIYYRLKGWI